MLSLAGVGCKQYQEWVGLGIPEVSCPESACQGARLRGRGWYRRYVGGVSRRLRRLRCPRCRVSHVWLPEDLCAYRDATFEAVESALSAGAPSDGAQAAGQGGGAGVRRVRRWLRSASGPLATALQALLAPAEGPWWRRAQELVGEAAGWLTRLRHWLWSRWRCFLGGVSGLYRHGRPRRRPPSPVPYLGNCPSRASGAKLCRDAPG